MGRVLIRKLVFVLSIVCGLGAVARDFHPDGTDGAAVQRAIDAAGAAGGGRVVLEPRTYATRALHMRSGVELHLPKGATIFGGSRSEDYDDYLEKKTGYGPENSNKALIVGSDLQDVAITGEGTIDCQGLAFFPSEVPQGNLHFAKPSCPRPRMLELFRCRNVRLEGVLMKDSPNWTCWFRACEDVAVRGLRIRADFRIINSDGLHFNACRRVDVRDCDIRTGDDCIVMRAGRNEVCEDLLVEDCRLESSCQCIRVSCPGDGVTRRGVFRRVKMFGRCGFLSYHPAAYTRDGRGGGCTMADILVEDSEIDVWGCPIRFGVERELELKDFGHVAFRNLRVRGGDPILLYGNGKTKLRDVRFENVTGVVYGKTAFRSGETEGLDMSGLKVAVRSAIVGIHGPRVQDGEARQFEYRRETNQTEKIQRAIDDVFRCGGGKVILQPGFYLVGGLRLRSNVWLHLRAGVVLRGVRDCNAYRQLETDTVEPFREEDFPPVPDPLKNSWNSMFRPASVWNRAMIRIVGAHDVILTGEPGAVIDGANSFDPKGEEGYRGVHGISVSYATNLLFRGYTVRHSGNWAHRIDHAVNVCCEGVTVLAGHDGFHVRHCDNVRIVDSVFHTGDDSIAGYDNQNVHVADCDLSSACSAFRFAGTDVLIERCTAWGPCDYLFRGSLSRPLQREGLWDPTIVPGRHTLSTFFLFFTGRPAIVRRPPGNIVIRDCEVRNASRFLRYNHGELWQQGTPLADIRFERVKATGLQLPLAARSLEADKPVKLAFEKCSFQFNAPQTELIAGGNVAELTLKDVEVRGVKGPALRVWEGEPTLTAENVSGVEPGVGLGRGKFDCPARPKVWTD